MTDRPLRVSTATLKTFVVSVFDRWGAPPAIADLTADLIVRTDLRGVEGQDRIDVAGEPEWECEQRRRREGIPLAPGLVSQLREVSVEAGVSFTLGA